MGDYNVFHEIPWTGAYALYFFTVGLSAALFFFSARSFFEGGEVLTPIRKMTAYLSFALLVVSGLLLIGDLSQPMRFLNTINPMYMNFASPLAWGALNLISFGLASVAYIYLLWTDGNGRTKWVALIGAALGMCLPIYTGFDLTVHQNRPVWNTPLMPVLFVALALASGAAVALFIARGDAAMSKHLRGYLMWSTLAVGIMLVALLGTTAYGGVGQELTFLSLTSGSLAVPFLWIGAILGTLVPLALLVSPVGKNTMGLMACGALVLVGGYALRHSILIGGQIVQSYF